MTKPSASGTNPSSVPPQVMAMQTQIEKLYLKTLALERDVAQLRATQPVIVTRPKRGSVLLRAMRKANPRMRRRFQLDLIRDCGLFDPQWYLAKYSDVRQTGEDPALHYLVHGATDLRDPGPHFDTGHYLRMYPDITDIGLNPLVHYVVAGIDEGRSIRPEIPHRS